MNNNPLKYVWCTYRDWSFQILQGLQDLEDWETSLIVTTPDCLFDFSAFEERGIPIVRDNPKKTLKKGGQAFEQIITLKPATIFHYGWSWIVPPALLELCPNVTLHPGKLPKDRGGSPLQNQIINGETWTYANVLKMEQGLDTGPVYMSAKISLEGNITDVWARMTATGCRVTRDYLTRLAQGGFEPTPQVDEEPSFYNRVTPEQSELKPDQESAFKMHNKIRALCETDPNTYVRPAFYMLGKHRIIIDRSTLDSRIEKALGACTVLNDEETQIPDIYALCEGINENKRVAALKDTKGDKVYLTRVYMKK